MAKDTNGKVIDSKSEDIDTIWRELKDCDDPLLRETADIINPIMSLHTELLHTSFEFARTGYKIHSAEAAKLEGICEIINRYSGPKGIHLYERAIKALNEIKRYKKLFQPKQEK